MDRQQEALKLADDLLADIELSRLGTEQCLLKASRLARLVKDEQAQLWIEFELHGYDTSAAAKYYMARVGRWSKEGEADVGYYTSFAKVQAVLMATRDEVTALQGASFSGQMIVVTQNNLHNRLTVLRNTISTLAAIDSGLRTVIYEFVARTYHELVFSEIQAGLFIDVQTQINSHLSPASGSALTKIDTINERLTSGDTESISHAMTTCRRLIDSVADSVYPAREDSVLVDGQPTLVKQPNTLNRLAAFAYEKKASKGQRDRLRRSLKDIYDRVSKGVHSDVTESEAKFVFLQTYILLGEVLMLKPAESEG